MVNDPEIRLHKEWLGLRWKIPVSSSIVEARQRTGAAVMTRLFHKRRQEAGGRRK